MDLKNMKATKVRSLSLGSDITLIILTGSRVYRYERCQPSSHEDGAPIS